MDLGNKLLGWIQDIQDLGLDSRYTRPCNYSKLYIIVEYILSKDHCYEPIELFAGLALGIGGPGRCLSPRFFGAFYVYML